jgi:eukaryotic translation initiation factor 2C
MPSDSAGQAGALRSSGLHVPEDAPFFLPPVLQVWLGYQQSLRPSQGGLTLNMDMAATAFLEPRPVIDFLLRAVGLRSPQDFARLTPQQHRAASKAITGIKVWHDSCGMMHDACCTCGLTWQKLF